MTGKKKSDPDGRLLAAASRLFHRRGYAAVSLREVAAAAGTTPDRLRRLYPRKAALARAVAEARRAAVARLLDGIAESADTPMARTPALSEALAATARTTARAGCPLARLSADLADAPGAEAAAARATAVAAIGDVEAFVAGALVDAGRPGAAATAGARRYVAAWQGASALAQARGDAALYTTLLGEAAAELAGPAGTARTQKAART